MSNLVGPILAVIKLISRPIKKYLDYHRKFNKYVEDIKQVQADLHAREADIQQKLKDELRYGKKPKQEVERWLKKVKEEFGHAQCVEDKVNTGKYLFQCCLGKLVDEATQAMKQVYAEGDFSGSLVVNDPSTTIVKLPTEELVGAAKVEEIYEYLIGDEVRKIGVCGMGGIGKTTIMMHVHNKLLEENKCGKLIWANVSQNFNIRGFQKKIASQLKEKLSDDEDTIIRAAKLSEMLRKQGRYVLILDDVWSDFSLANVGILEPTVDNGCKLVLTTRSGETVRLMGCKEVRVSLLSTDQAWQLFLSKVGRDMLPNPTIESTMKLVVEECDGLPLAIVTIAGCMRGKSDPLAWENALSELRGYIRNIQDMEDKVFGCLKFSYDRLKQLDQYCFLYCALYPEDHEILKEELIEHWMEEGLINEMETRKAMQDNGRSILQKLEENCLLERTERDTHIKMHDVVRDMALQYITKRSPRFFVKAGMQLTEVPDEQQWTEDLEKVSLMRNSISKIPPNIPLLKYQGLTTLLLSHNQLEEIAECFFVHMPNLKILDLSANSIKSLPNSLSNLENLTTLLLSNCRELKSVPSLSKLKALKKLDLERTSISKIPQGFEMLINLRYLNLRSFECLEEIPNGLLSKLCRLQYLEILSAFTKAKDMRELNKLEVFKGCFSNVGDLSIFAGQRKRLHSYSIWVCPEDDFKVNYDFFVVAFEFDKNTSKKVVLSGIVVSCGDGIIVPNDTQQLHVYECKGMGSSLNDISGLKDTINLKECEILGVDELESLFSSKCRQLETLEYLRLERLQNLKDIARESSASTFSFLRKIRIMKCGKIKNVLSAKWVLHNLEEIAVKKCEKMEEIIESEEQGMSSDTVKYALLNLRSLILDDLPKLKRVCSKNGVMVCDSLQSMRISNCPMLKRFPLYLPLHDHERGKPSPPVKEICVDPKEWWESVEWDHPHAKNVLLPFLQFWDHDNYEWKRAV